MKMTSLLDRMQESRELWEDKTPCFVTDRTTIRGQLEKFSSLFNGEIAYSFKTNPHPDIARLIHQKGHNFTVCSIEELQQLQQIMGDISKIIYLSPALDEEELKEVLRLGIKRLSLDSPSQVEITAPYAQNLEEVFLRVATGHKVKKEDFPYEKNSYLGIPIDESLPYLETLSRTQIKLGIHNHLSSQNTDLESWQQNLSILTDFIQSAKQKTISLNSINFGGGFPIPYNKEVPSLEEIADIVTGYQRKIMGSYPNLKYPGINFVFEPGRYIVGESSVLITKVKQKKKFGDKNILIIDASTYNSSMDALLVSLDLPCQDNALRAEF